MVDVLLAPDPKLAVISYLSEHLDCPVVGTIPHKRPGVFVRVMLAGGSGVHRRVLDRTAFTVECWHQTEPEAARLAQRARALVMAADYMGGEPVYGLREWSSPKDHPDESGQPRYRQTIEMRMRRRNAVL